MTETQEHDDKPEGGGEHEKCKRQANRLTAKKIEKLKQPGRYPDGYNLYLQITENGSRSWLFRYQRGLKENGKRREHMIGLGPLHAVTLKEARERAKAARLQLADGDDPLSVRRGKRMRRRVETAQATTFRQAATRFLIAKEGEWTNERHRNQWRATLEGYVYPIIGDEPVSAIDTDKVCAVLEPIWTKQTAKRLRGRIERILDWAKVRGMRTGENPARWRGHLDKALAKPTASNKHHAALPYKDVPVFLTELRTREGVAARALEVTILSACRTREVLEAKWNEIDFNERVWVIPAERMKDKKKPRDHKVPLTNRMVEIVSGLPREANNPFVFVGERAGRPMNSRALFTELRLKRSDLTVHGFRSSFRDWASERTHADYAVVELSLAHQVGSAVERAYHRTDLFDKRRSLMEAWSAFCNGEETTGSNVVQLRAV